MWDIKCYKRIFDSYGGIMRAKQLDQENIVYRNIQNMIQGGYVEKIRIGYYQWIDPQDFSEVGIVICLFPDAVFCMDTALHYYGYSDRTPGKWHLAVN